MAARALALLGAAAIAALAGCGPTAKDIEAAQIHYDLGVNAMEQQHDAPSALKELETAVLKNPNMAEAQNAIGLVDHLMLHKPEEAVAHYLRALELNPKYSEAANNLGADYLDLGRYAEAAAMFRRVLADELYRTPYVAEGNLGWALYKSGDVAGAVQHLKAALAQNRGYCQGYRSLGLIDAETGRLEDAEQEFSLFHEKCPDVPEASYRLGLVLLKEGKQDRAREELAACADAKAAKDTDVGTACARLLKLMQ
ncbi:MAG: social motility TPR repeat lipoprotein Tgl [Myxococcales bacterium]